MLSQADIVSIYMSHDIDSPYLSFDDALAHKGAITRSIIGFAEIKNANDYTHFGDISDIKIDGKTYVFVSYGEFAYDEDDFKMILYLGVNFAFTKQFSCVYTTFTMFENRNEGIELSRNFCENGLWFKDQKSVMSNVADYGHFHDRENIFNTLR